MNNILKHGSYEVTFVGDLDKCLSQKETLTEEYNQLCLKIERIDKRNTRVKLITLIIGIALFSLCYIGLISKIITLCVISAVGIIFCCAVFKTFMNRVNFLGLSNYKYPAGVSATEYKEYKNGLASYIIDKMGNKLQIYEALKSNKVRGVTFRFNGKEKDINNCDIIFCIENSDGIISNVNLESVTIQQSIKEQYKNKIELNVEKNFEITYYYYDEFPIRWKGV